MPDRRGADRCMSGWASDRWRRSRPSSPIPRVWPMNTHSLAVRGAKHMMRAWRVWLVRRVTRGGGHVVRMCWPGVCGGGTGRGLCGPYRLCGCKRCVSRARASLHVANCVRRGALPRFRTSMSLTRGSLWGELALIGLISGVFHRNEACLAPLETQMDVRRASDVPLQVEMTPRRHHNRGQ